MRIFNPVNTRILTGLLGVALLGGVHAQDDLLDPEKAFRVQVHQKDAQTVVARFDVAKDYYLYKDRMRFSVKDAPGVTIQSIKYPAGIVKQDPNFGKVEVFKSTVEVELLLKRTAGSNKMTLLTDYQGCEEKRGVCYMPMQKSAALTLR